MGMCWFLVLFILTKQNKNVSGLKLVSIFGDKEWTFRSKKESKYPVTEPKGCSSFQTEGQWSWMSSSAKKCVTTYLSKWRVPKIDDAYWVSDLGPFFLFKKECVELRFGCLEGVSVKITWTAKSADLCFSRLGKKRETFSLWVSAFFGKVILPKVSRS